MTKKKTGSSKPRGRPVSAIAGDFATVVEKSNWELDKFNAKVANNMGKILEEYYNLAFTAEKENTRLMVLKDLIKMQKDLVEVVEATEDLEKKMDKDDDDDSTLDMGNIISLDFEEKKQM